MAKAIKSDPPEEALAGQSAKESTMNNEEQETPSLSYGVIEAVDAYLKLLGTKKLPPNIATAVQAAKAEYEATG